MRLPYILSGINKGGDEIEIYGVTTHAGTINPTITFPDEELDDLHLIATCADSLRPEDNIGGWFTRYNASDDPMYQIIGRKYQGFTTSSITHSDITRSTVEGVSIKLSIRNSTAIIEQSILNNAGSSGMPIAPSYTLTSADNGKLVLLFGFLDDDVVTSVTAPSTYTMVAFENENSPTTLDYSTIMCAYAIYQHGVTDLSPSAFGGSGDDRWVSVTLVIS